MRSPVKMKTRPEAEHGSPRREFSSPKTGVNHQCNLVYVDPPEETLGRAPQVPVAPQQRSAAARRDLDASAHHGPSSQTTRSNATPNVKSRLSPNLQKQQMKQGQSLKNRSDIDCESQASHGKVMSSSGNDAGNPSMKKKPPLKKKPVRRIPVSK
jgi:hypothetical protein